MTRDLIRLHIKSYKVEKGMLSDRYMFRGDLVGVEIFKGQESSSLIEADYEVVLHEKAVAALFGVHDGELTGKVIPFGVAVKLPE